MIIWFSWAVPLHDLILSPSSLILAASALLLKHAVELNPAGIP